MQKINDDLEKKYIAVVEEKEKSKSWKLPQ